MSVRWFRRWTMLTIAGVCFLTIAGGVVRLTGSGLGCDDWPACNNERFIDVSSGHTAIEQINRLFSGLIAIPMVLMVVGAFRLREFRAGVKGPSIGVLLSILANGVVGGFAVLGDLHPVLVQSHFVLAMVAIAFGLVAFRRSGHAPEDRVEPVPGRIRTVFAAIGAMTAVSVVTGTVVTGTGPHAGDEDARRFGFDISQVAEIHSVSVLITAAIALGLLIVLQRREPALATRFGGSLGTWMFLVVLQGGIGYVQYFSAVPETLVAAHIAGATAVWVATVLLVLDGVGDGVRSTRPAAVERVEQMTPLSDHVA
ncbi:MAG: COX15/CtaA family protein [Actinomycetota bacterium]